jgi:hypothetical protein
MTKPIKNMPTTINTAMFIRIFALSPRTDRITDLNPKLGD